MVVLVELVVKHLHRLLKMVKLVVLVEAVRVMPMEVLPLEELEVVIHSQAQ